MQARSRNVAKVAMALSVCLSAALFTASFAQATEGYFQNGFGARQSALAGAGVADSRDAMSLSLNPAGLVDAKHQFQVGLTLFSPWRSYSATGTALVAPGSYDSNDNYFVVPNLAYSSPIDADSAWGIAIYGNGGMNTNWPNMANTTGACAGFFGGKPGVYCGSSAGVDLMQAFISVGYSRRIGNFSIGVAPVFAIQRFKAEGLAAFAGYSSNAANLTDNGFDYSYGGGLHAGVQWNVAPNFRIGIAGQTPTWMTKFSKYSGLFADGGNMDIPGDITAGLAWDVTSALTLMVDYKRIFYSRVPSIANSSAITGPGVQGLGNGPGFGWYDVDIFKIGAEWRATPAWTFRVGYAHNTNPVQSADATLNILAPGVVTDHLTGGFAYQASHNSTIELAAAYAPSHSVSGSETLGPPFAVPTPGSNIEIKMHQYQFTLGWTYQFDGKPASTALIYK